MSSSPVATFTGLIPCLLIFSILAGVVIVLLVYLRRRNPIQQEPACAHCGYNVTGLPTCCCPECGSDLRAVGIIAVGSRKPLPPLVRAVIWSLVLPAPAMAISFALMAAVPLEARSSHAYTIMPSSRAYAQIAVCSEGWGPYANQLPANRITLQLTPSLATAGQAAKTDLTVNPVDLSYQYPRPDGEVVKAPGGFDAHVILDWMEAWGVDGGNPAVQQETGELLSQIQMLGSGAARTPMTQSFTYGAASGSFSSGPPFWLKIALLATWPAVWLLGLWRVTRKQRPTPPPNAEPPQQPVESA